jgi:hypothetical protein
MTHVDYSLSITAKITAREALERISRVSEWWTKGFTGASQKLGDRFTVRFGETFVDFTIVEVIPEERTVWQVTNSYLHWINNKTEWTGTRIVWEVLAEHETTTVRMTHVGLHPGVECYENCEVGWNFCCGESLLKLLRENKGLPDGRYAVALKALMAELRAEGKQAPYSDDEIDKMDVAAVRGALKLYGR